MVKVLKYGHDNFICTNVYGTIYIYQTKCRLAMGQRFLHSVEQNSTTTKKSLFVKDVCFPHCHGIGCGTSFGIEKNDNVGYQMTASSGAASDGWLYNEYGAWCADVRSDMEYLQVDLKGIATVRGLATQGHPTTGQWIKTFAIKYSYDQLEWLKFNDDQSSWKV